MKLFYAVENLRSLKKTPDIELRPITILVGRNSAGKSTFLRSLALLRQSIEAKSSAPILWYGDYVDFGDFSSAVNQKDKDKEVSFRFVADDFSVRSRELEYMYRYDDYVGLSRRTLEYSRVVFQVFLGEQLGRTTRKTIHLEIPEQNILLRARFAKDGNEAESFLVNDVELSDLLPGHSVIFNSSDIFSSGILTTTVKSGTLQSRRPVSPVSAFSNYISSLVRPHVDKRILVETINRQAFEMLLHPILTADVLIELSEKSDTASFEKFYLKLIDGSFGGLLKKINIACAMNHALQALSDSGKFFRDFFSGTTYLGPARARSERYYRFQELEVSEIASDGHNLPMFLGSLTQKQLSSFSDWVRNLFGFDVGVQRNEGHISIQLKRDKLNINVTDTGYGVSQLLPVLAQIWWSSKAAGRTKFAKSSGGKLVSPITMEQPELHLHPAHQARLADALLNALPQPGENARKSPVFVVETHSETMINRLGELIEENKLNAEDVQVVIFSNEDLEPNSTTIEVSSFDSDGTLVNWPFGFFNY